MPVTRALLLQEDQKDANDEHKEPLNTLCMHASMGFLLRTLRLS